MHATLYAEASTPTMTPTPSPDCPAPRRWIRWVLALVIVTTIGRVSSWAWQIYGSGNVHEVVPGRVFRGAQPNAASLEKLIAKHKIRTVLNVRGCCYPDAWYVAEGEVCERLGVQMIDVSFSAVHLPSKHELRQLLETLDRAEYPIFVHCRHGADRTGLVAMAVHLLQGDESFESAHRHLGLRYGHVAIGKTGTLDRFMALYADWLKRESKTHEPRHFRNWILNEYQGGWCNVTFEKVERLFDTPKLGKRLEYEIVVRNTGPTAWNFHPLKTAGHHVTFKIEDDKHRVVHEGRAGLMRKTVAPGESIQVILSIPPIRRPGHYRLLIDMIEEGHCWFHQTGSEVWEEEWSIRE